MNKLKEMRQKRGLSQYQLASEAGIHYRTLQYYEQGYLKFDHCNIDKIFKVALVLGCNVEDILEDPETIKLVKQYHET